MTDWNREEIEAAYQHFVAAGDAQDWDAVLAAATA